MSLPFLSLFLKLLPVPETYFPVQWVVGQGKLGVVGGRGRVCRRLKELGVWIEKILQCIKRTGLLLPQAEMR